jgi:cyclopropane-fatty-acyl-phospholipid synthase
MDSHHDRLPSQDGSEVLGRASPAPASPVTGIDRSVIRTLLKLAGNPPVTVGLWDGRVVSAGGPDPVAHLVIRDRRALLRMFLSPDVGFGDSYADGLIEVEGDLVQFLESVYRALGAAPPGVLRTVLMRWVNRPRPNSLATARDNIRHHYDIGNDFYRLWLDERMVYTCAYYRSASATLEEAQIAKLDHVCRKLRLEPGLSVVEAGCGWGALALHMARHYGARVMAYNISRQQLAYAREQARAQGLEDRVTFVEDDYRNITGRFDRFVSVGMLEHVGPEHYQALGRVIHRTLEPDGLGLIHTIGRNSPRPNNAWTERRIFPGSRPPSLSEMARIFEPWDFSVLDVENLRRHYARTCQDWLGRFDRVADRVEQTFDRRFVRMWRLYLAGSVSAFSTGSLQLFQVVFAPGASNAVPWTRYHVYREDGAGSDPRAAAPVAQDARR